VRTKIEEALGFLSTTKLYMKRRGFEEVPQKGAVTTFRQRMGTDFNRRHKFAAPLAIHQIADNLNTECLLYDITNFYTFIQEHEGNEPAEIPVGSNGKWRRS